MLLNPPSSPSIVTVGKKDKYPAPFRDSLDIVAVPQLRACIVDRLIMKFSEGSYYS
jgi:hypothetical protein